MFVYENRNCSFAELSFCNITQHNKNKRIQLSVLLTTFNLLLSCMQLTLLIQRTAQVYLFLVLRVLVQILVEYSINKLLG